MTHFLNLSLRDRCCDKPTYVFCFLSEKMNNYESIPRSHLLVSELVKNFARKADELTRLRREIDTLSDGIRSGEFKETHRGS